MKTLLLFMITLLGINSVLFSQQWTQVSTPQGGGVTDMIVLADGTIIVTTASFNWPATSTRGGVRRSTDGGTTWENTVDVYNARTLYRSTTGKLFASYWPYPANEGLIYSTNNGMLWISGYSVGANNNIFSIHTADNDQTVYIGTRTGVLKSTNGGLNFTATGPGIPANTFVYDLDIDYTGSYIAAGTSKGLYVSSDNGSNWIPVSGVPQTDTIYTLKFVHFTTDGAIPENKLIAGSTNGELFMNSTEFTAALLIYTFFGKIGKLQVIKDAELEFLGAGLLRFGADNSVNAGFALSTDRGLSWYQTNNGLPSDPLVSALAYQVQGNSIRYYAGMFENTSTGAKVYRMDSPIGIHQISSEVPNAFSLSQNYPNPFNPMTKIKFNVSKASNVNITVFDVLGRHITTLVNEKLNAGEYETEWDAINMPGGIYFYRLETDDFTETKKMILVK